ncbi:hypothetical protein Tco_0704984 [Tanacetum coccineum]|uniref:Reverse transcriptase Ty1/copia-type domain-containing protein n=1 Tax=Tanacetum coccineum TaxID=301880 RepID=A0ABQ4Y4W8_9ASTR
MSMMGDVKFFLGLQVHQSLCGIFISQSKYTIELLKKHGMDECDSMNTPMATARLDANLQGTLTDQMKYRQMIEGLMCLTANRPYIAFATFVCARYQARPTVKHLKEVKRIFSYLRQSYNMGLWYPKESSFEIIAYSDADHAWCHDDCKSMSGGLLFQGEKLVSWSSKKQDCTALSTAEAEVENDNLVKNIFNSRKNKGEAGMKIPNWMLIDEMRLTNHYKIFRAPRRQEPEPETLIPTAVEIDVTNLYDIIQMSIATQRSLDDFEAQQNVSKVNERLEDEELDHLLEGNENANVDEFMNDIFNSQEDHGTRIDPKSNKESLEAEINTNLVPVNTNEEEEGSAEDEYELRRRVKGNGIGETRSSPPPTPIRSHKTHIAPLSTNKETLRKLTVITEDAPSSADKEKL